LHTSEPAVDNAVREKFKICSSEVLITFYQFAKHKHFPKGENTMRKIDPIVERLIDAIKLHRKDMNTLDIWLRSFQEFSAEINRRISVCLPTELTHLLVSWMTQFVFLRDHLYLAHYGTMTRSYQREDHAPFLTDSRPSDDDLRINNARENYPLSLASNYGLIGRMKIIEYKV